MEHFSFEMQFLLDEYIQGKIQFEELKKDYETIDTEGHDLEEIKAILEAIKKANIQVHAGFLPWPYAEIAMNKDNGLESALQQSKVRRYIPDSETAKDNLK